MDVPLTTLQGTLNSRQATSPTLHKRKWQPTPVFLLGNPMDRGDEQATVHGGHNRVGHPWATEHGHSQWHSLTQVWGERTEIWGGRKERADAEKVILPFKVYSSMVFTDVCNCHYGQTYNIFMTSEKHSGTSLMVQWFRICLLMQRRWVCFLVQEDPTCCRATKPCTTGTEVTCCSYWSLHT